MNQLHVSSVTSVQSFRSNWKKSNCGGPARVVKTNNQLYHAEKTIINLNFYHPRRLGIKTNISFICPWINSTFPTSDNCPCSRCENGQDRHWQLNQGRRTLESYHFLQLQERRSKENDRAHATYKANK
jgi:hypothetical protein